MNTRAPSDRRRARRHSVRMPCQAVCERGFTLLGEIVIDLSADGMLLRTDRRVLTGEPVIVSFFEPHTARWFDTEATVARVVHRRRAGDVERCVGLQFESIDRAARAGLEHALRLREARVQRDRAPRQDRSAAAR